MAAYTQIRKPLKDALSSPGFGRDSLDLLQIKLEEKARRETGYQRDEAMRCAIAVRAFQETFTPRSLSRYRLDAGVKGLSKGICGVKLNISLDATVTAQEEDSTFAGGLVLRYAFAANRGDIKDQLATTAGLILWALEDGQLEPLPRLCMAVDLAERSIVKASSSHGRLRSRVTDTCAEIASLWSGVEPPNDYDGPEWR